MDEQVLWVNITTTSARDCSKAASHTVITELSDKKQIAQNRLNRLNHKLCTKSFLHSDQQRCLSSGLNSGQLAI